MQNRDRLHRSELAVPASNLRMLEKAPDAGADIVFLDLEDAVAPDDKVQARANAIDALRSQDWSKTATSVRIKANAFIIKTRAGNDFTKIRWDSVGAEAQG